MRKTLAFLLAFLAGVWAIPAAAVGTIPGISLSQQFDSTGLPLGGGLLYLIQAGTTSTPQNCFQDTAMTIAYPNPVILDAYGRVPQLFCADGQIKVRLTDKNGVQKFVQDNLLIIGASSGGGGGGTVDPTTILATGDFKMEYNTGPISGFVRCNGRTIGSATSGASERANADTNALFSFLWTADPNLAVSGGRGASAAADFAANKTITIPDCRGRTLSGLDDMGNSAAGILTSTYFGASPTVLGAIGGAQASFLSINNINPFTPTVSGFSLTAAVGSQGSLNTGAGGTPASAFAQGNNLTAPSQLNATVSGSITMNSLGGGQAHSIVGPRILMTIYIKL